MLRRLREVLSGAACRPQQRVDHHVADHLGAIGEALGGEVAHGGLGRPSSRSAEVVGHDPVAFLRHARVERAKPGLDVGEPRPATVDYASLAATTAAARVEFVSP